MLSTASSIKFITGMPERPFCDSGRFGFSVDSTGVVSDGTTGPMSVGFEIVLVVSIGLVVVSGLGVACVGFWLGSVGDGAGAEGCVAPTVGVGADVGVGAAVGVGDAVGVGVGAIVGCVEDVSVCSGAVVGVGSVGGNAPSAK